MDIRSTRKNRILSALLSIMVIGMLIMAGPAQAVSVTVDNLSSPTPLSGETVTFDVDVSVAPSENIPVSGVFLQVGATKCLFDIDGTRISADAICQSFTLTQTASGDFGFGYGYGNGQSFGYGYGYGYGSTGQALAYTVSWDTTGYTGSHSITFGTTADTTDFTSNTITITPAAAVTVASDDIGSLFGTAFTSTDGGITIDTQADVTITHGNNSVVIPDGTVISTLSGAPISSFTLADATGLSMPAGFSTSGALQWGIPGLGLTFSQPITINIYVGTAFNGMTLSVIHSVDGTTWDTTGIETSCTVSAGVCSFQATRASYYASGTSTTTESTSTGGNGRRSVYIPTVTPAPKYTVQDSQTERPPEQTAEQTEQAGTDVAADAGVESGEESQGNLITGQVTGDGAGVQTFIWLGILAALIVAGFAYYYRRK
jgi:hypothetical protein